MIRRILMATSALGVLSLLSACGSSDDDTAPVSSTQPSASAAPTPSPPTDSAPPSAPASTQAQSGKSQTSPAAPEPASTNAIDAAEAGSIAGTVVRFTANDTHV